MRRKTTEATAAMNKRIGAKLRERRTQLGLTQLQLAEMLDVTYQQAHKYERGINRISAAMLFDIARKMNVPVTYFGDDDEPVSCDAPGRRAKLEAAKIIGKLENPAHIAAISDLARRLSRNPEPEHSPG